MAACRGHMVISQACWAWLCMQIREVGGYAGRWQRNLAGSPESMSMTRLSSKSRPQETYSGLANSFSEPPVASREHGAKRVSDMLGIGTSASSKRMRRPHACGLSFDHVTCRHCQVRRSMKTNISHFGRLYFERPQTRAKWLLFSGPYGPPPC